MGRRVRMKVPKKQIRTQTLIVTTSSTLCQKKKTLDAKCAHMWDVPVAGDSEAVLLAVL